jgi:hypothetical protein
LSEGVETGAAVFCPRGRGGSEGVETVAAVLSSSPPRSSISSSEGFGNGGHPGGVRLLLQFLGAIGVRRGVAIDSLKFHPGPPCPTLLCPASGPTLKQPYGRFKGDPPAGRAVCSRLLPLWTQWELSVSDSKD